MTSSAVERTAPQRAGGIRPWLVPAGAVLLLVAFLLPVIHAPFFSDDVTGSELNGYRTLHGDGLLGLYGQLVWDFVVHGGRPQIFSGLPGYPVFVLLGDNTTGYHVFLLALTALDAALLYGLLRRLRAPAAAAALVVVLAATWMQLRIYHDSMFSFAGLVQVVMALVTGSLWLFARWLDEGRTRDLAWAVALFFVACGIYEVAYSLCLAHVALAVAYRGRAGLRASAPFLGVAAVFAVATFLLRQVSDSVATGYTSGGSGGPVTILSTYAVQLVSPLPATSILSDSSIAGDPSTGELFAALWRGLVAAGVVAAIGIALARQRAVRWAPIVAVGLGFYFGPPALLSVAAKYQEELSTSRAYIPVLIQVFGLAILATAGLGALLRLAAGRGRAAVVAVVAGAALFAGVSGGVTAFNNVRVLGIIQPDRAARELVEAGAERGAFAQAPPGSSLLFSASDMTWQGPTVFGGYPYVPLMLADKTGHTYDARVIPAPNGRFAPGSCPRRPQIVQRRCAAPGRRAAWARVRLRRDGGTVVVAPIARATPTGFVEAASGRTLTVYRELEKGGAEPQPPRLTGRLVSGPAWSSDGGTWTRKGGGHGWARWQLRLPAGPAPVASSLDDEQGFVNFLAMPPSPQRARLMGTRRLLP